MGLAIALQALQGDIPTDYLPAIENFLDLVKIVCLRKGGHDIWAIANTQGDLTQFSFSASYQCIHTNEAHHGGFTVDGVAVDSDNGVDRLRSGLRRSMVNWSPMTTNKKPLRSSVTTGKAVNHISG